MMLLLWSVAATGQTKNDWKRMKLIGNVDTITETEYAALNGKSEKGALKSTSVTTFDAGGNRLFYITYGPSGEVLSRSVFNYDAMGVLIDVKRYRADGGLNVTTVYKHDKVGNEAEESNTDASGTLFMTAKSKYDLNGNRIVYDRYDLYGHLFLRSNLKYDKRGNEIQEREYDSHESLQFVTTWQYASFDKQGNWTERVMLKNDEPRTITVRAIKYR